MVGTLFEKGGPLEQWLGVLDDGIERFAKYIGTDDFQADVKGFVDGIGTIARAVVKVAAWLSPSVPESNASGSRLFSNKPLLDLGPLGTIDPKFAPGSFLDRATRGPINNPGNLRIPGSSVGFQQFPTVEAGLQAMARQLRLYQNRDHLDTISGIINKYAPASENDVRSYVGDVAKRTGFGADQHLNLNDPQTLSQLIAAMTKHENGKSNYSPKTVVEIINNTGGNAIPIVNQVAQ